MLITHHHHLAPCRLLQQAPTRWITIFPSSHHHRQLIPSMTITVAAPTDHVLRHHLRPIVPPRGRPPGHRRRRLLFAARAAARHDDDTIQSPSESMMKPAASAMQLLSSNKDYSHTLFHTECLEVLGLVDLESLRKRPRLTVGVTVKASVVLPVLVVLAVLYLTDMAKGVVDWTAHHHQHPEPEGEDVVGD